jgi:hypothetical protein
VLQIKKKNKFSREKIMSNHFPETGEKYTALLEKIKIADRVDCTIVCICIMWTINVHCWREVLICISKIQVKTNI